MNAIVKKYYHTDILKQACAAYKINMENAQLIRSNRNLIYDGGDKILRISHSDLRGITDVEAELSWLHFLIENKLPVVQIIPSTADTPFVQIGEKDNYFTVVCFEKIIGNTISKASWNEQHFERLGKLTGLLHRVGGSYKSPEHIVYKGWDNLYEHHSYQYLPQDKRELIQLHQTIVHQINQLPKTTNNYGLIHYDIHHENYLLTNENTDLRLFDFELTCTSWFINDIATVLYYTHLIPKKISTEEFETNFMTAFWKGYEREHSIHATEKKWIPKFLLYRDLMLYGLVSHLWKEKKLSDNQSRYLDKIQASIKVRRDKQGI